MNTAFGILLWLMLACAPARRTSVDSSLAASSQKAPTLRGGYGFLTDFECAPEDQVRARVRVMSQHYGITEFQFYDWFADYSTPTRGEKWLDPFFRKRSICLQTIEILVDEIHKQGGRAWAYVQSVAAEETGLADPAREIYKLIDRDGHWYWHAKRFPTYFLNAAWAAHMVETWAPGIVKLHFDGIHWDTLGAIAGSYEAERAGVHAFLAKAKTLLKPYKLPQTMNFVNLSWFDQSIVRSNVEFSYAETWSDAVAAQYWSFMDSPQMQGVMGVWAMYPSVRPSNKTSTQIILERWSEAPKHHLVYLIVGDGAKHMINEYWPETIPFSDEEANAMHAQ